MEESKPTIRRVMWGRRFLASTVVVPPGAAEHLNTYAGEAAHGRTHRAQKSAANIA